VTSVITSFSNREKADTLMGDLLKDTMFESKEALDELEPAKQPIEPESAAPIAPNTDHHLYEDINDFDSIFKKAEVEVPGEEKKANLVKLRKKDNANEESRSRKIYRRLSFSRERNKTASHPRKAREAEDFEMVNVPTDPELLDAQTAKASTTSTPGKHHHTDQHEHSSASKFAGLFTLTRKGSRRDTSKGKHDVLSFFFLFLRGWVFCR